MYKGDLELCFDRGSSVSTVDVIEAKEVWFDQCAIGHGLAIWIPNETKVGESRMMSGLKPKYTKILIDFNDLHRSIEHNFYQQRREAMDQNEALLRTTEDVLGSSLRRITNSLSQLPTNVSNLFEQKREQDELMKIIQGSCQLSQSTVTTYKFAFGTLVARNGLINSLKGQGNFSRSARHRMELEFIPSVHISTIAIVAKLELRGLQRSIFSPLRSLQFWPEVSEKHNSIRYAQTGSIAGLRGLFQSGKANPLVRTPAGWTLLHVGHSEPVYRCQLMDSKYAAARGHLDTCKFLLEHGASAAASGFVGVYDPVPD